MARRGRVRAPIRPDRRHHVKPASRAFLGSAVYMLGRPIGCATFPLTRTITTHAHTTVYPHQHFTMVDTCTCQNNCG